MPLKTSDMGAAFLYELSGAAWSLFEEVASNVKDDLFGYDVAVSADRAVVGAPGDSSPLPHQGAAYVYEGLRGLPDLLGHLVFESEIPLIEVGCEIVDCCPGCPGPPFELDWRIRLSGSPVEAVVLWFTGLSPEASRRMEIKGNGRWLGLNQLRVGRGQTILRGFSVGPKGRAPVAVPKLLFDEAAVRKVTAQRGGKEIGSVELVVEQLLGQVVVSEYKFSYNFDEALRSR
jgi:hypothetical protein